MTDLRTVLLRLRETCLLMVGIPDYDRYVELCEDAPSRAPGDDSRGVLLGSPEEPVCRR